MMATAAPMNLALLFGAELGSRHTSCVTRQIHVIGIGAGDPQYVTAQAIAALNDTQVFFAMDKGEVKNDLVVLRRTICERFIRDPSYRFVELADPPRAKDGELSASRRGLAHGPGPRLGAGHRVRTRTRRRRRLPGVGRPVAV